MNNHNNNKLMMVIDSDVINKTKTRKRVLDEDTFVGMLEDVIEKQYFPHLSKMKKQLEFLKQHEKFSLNTLRNTYNRLVPVNHDSDQSDHQDIGSSTTVAEFFARYTSEDNQSFEEVLAKDIADKRRKYHWLHESLDQFAITDGRESITTEKKAGMLMLYHIGNKVLSADERARVDAILAGEKVVGDERPAQVDSWAFRVRNQLMFYPELQDSAQISGITASRAGNVMSNSLLLAAAINNSSNNSSNNHDPRLRSALPASTASTSSQLLLASSKPKSTKNPSNDSQYSVTDKHSEDDKKSSSNFVVPLAPTRKSLPANLNASSTSTELVQSATQSSRDEEHRQMQLYTDSYANTDPRRAEKFVQAKNTSTPGAAFADSIDAYLRGQTYRPAPSEAAVVAAILPTPVMPMENAHTPSTIHSQSPSSKPHIFGRTIIGQKLDTLLPPPPPQMPVLHHINATTKNNIFNKHNLHSHGHSNKNSNMNEEWETASIQNDHYSHHGRNHQYVEMTPLIMPGEGLLISPIVTWGYVCGPIEILDGPLLAQLQQMSITVEKNDANNNVINVNKSDGDSGNDSDNDNHSNSDKKKKAKKDKKQKKKSRKDEKRASITSRERNINPSATSLTIPSSTINHDYYASLFPKTEAAAGNEGMGYQPEVSDGVSFFFQPQRSREQLAWKLDAQTQAKKQKREPQHHQSYATNNSNVTPLSTPVGTTRNTNNSGGYSYSASTSSSVTATPRRLADLTPAAQSLAKKVQASMLKQQQSLQAKGNK